MRPLLLLPLILTIFAPTRTVAAADRIRFELTSGRLRVVPSNGVPFRAEIEFPGSTVTAASDPVVVNDPVWGRGRRLELNHGDRVTTLALYDDRPVLHLTSRVGNQGSEPLDLPAMVVARIRFEADIEATRLNTLGSGGLRPHDKPQGSYAYSALVDPETRNGVVCGWVTQRRGVGLMKATFEDGVHGLETSLDFGRLRVRPGESRETDTLMLGFFPDARLGLESYASQIAMANDIRLRPKPAVYCTWYHRAGGSGASTEKFLAENAAFARKQLEPFGLSVFQIDDHWQSQSFDGPKLDKPVKKTGPTKVFAHANDRFPNGMAATAAGLRDAGFVPGIWFMPFAGNFRHPGFDPGIFARDKSSGEPFHAARWSGTCIDATSPKGEAFLRQRVKRIYDWGYRYFKLDGMHTGMPSDNIYVNRAYEGTTFAAAEIHNPDMTFVESYRRGLDLVHEQAPDAFLLGCTITQNMISFAPAFGLVDGMRVGPDNGGAGGGKWKAVTVGADFAGNLWFLNNRVWHNDPDPFYVRENNPLPKARWMASWQAVSGAMHSTSMQYEELSPERLDLIKRTLPPHNFNARPVDVLENEHPAIWQVGNYRVHVIGLFNWSENEEATVGDSFERIGLRADASYEVFDFWENRYLGPVTGRLEMKLAPAGCAVLALREKNSHPQLLSTSRHITQGLIDVLSEEWDPDAKELRGRSRVVAGDPYELRIVCPAGITAAKVEVSDSDAGISELQQNEGLVRVTVTPSLSGEIDWKVSFE